MAVHVPSTTVQLPRLLLWCQPLHLLGVSTRKRVLVWVFMKLYWKFRKGPLCWLLHWTTTEVHSCAKHTYDTKGNYYKCGWSSRASVVWLYVSLWPWHWDRYELLPDLAWGVLRLWWKCPAHASFKARVSIFRNLEIRISVIQSALQSRDRSFFDKVSLRLVYFAINKDRFQICREMYLN